MAKEIDRHNILQSEMFARALAHFFGFAGSPYYTSTTRGNDHVRTWNIPANGPSDAHVLVRAACKAEIRSWVDDFGDPGDVEISLCYEHDTPVSHGRRGKAIVVKIVCPK